MVLAGPWLMDKLIEYANNILVHFPDWVRAAEGLATPGLEPSDL
jgi:hypothetical protein